MAALKSSRVKLAVWTRFEVHNLEVEPGLAARQHEFEFRGKRIIIRLPKRPKTKDWHSRHAPITCWAHRVRGGRRVPVRYSIHEVEALLDTGRHRLVRDDAFARVDVSLFPQGQRIALDKICEPHFEMLNDAFEHWLAVLRWTSGFHTLGAPTPDQRKSKWGAYLADAETRRRFYAPAHLFTVRRAPLLTRRHWTQAQKALLAEQDIPVWQQYLAEAKQKVRAEDLRGVVLDTAIAVETLVRQLLSSAILRKSTSTAETLINTIPIARLLDKWYQLGFDSKQWREIDALKDLKSLFEIRNWVMHRGYKPGTDADRVYAGLSAAEAFIHVGEKWLQRRARTSDRRSRDARRSP